jgi:hypothetical protein
MPLNFVCKTGEIRRRRPQTTIVINAEAMAARLCPRAPLRMRRTRPIKQKPGVVSHPGANREFQFPYSAESGASSSPRLVGAWWRKSVVRSSNLPWRATSEYAIGAECRSFRDKRHQAASPVLTSRPTLWHQPCQNRSDQGGSGRVADVVDPTRMTPNRTFTR